MNCNGATFRKPSPKISTAVAFPSAFFHCNTFFNKYFVVILVLFIRVGIYIYKKKKKRRLLRKINDENIFKTENNVFFIYIYICVCVCVSVCIRYDANFI